MISEAEWLLNYTAEWPKLDQQLATTEQSLANEDQDRLSDGEMLEACQAATVLTIPNHAQGAAIGGGGYGSRVAIGTGARSTGSTQWPGTCPRP